MKKIISTIVFGLVIIPAISFASINSNLNYGSRGVQVTELQEFLISKGFLQTQSTGNFYSLTLKAVKAFQSANNIPSTGYVGILTRTEINNELLAETSSSTMEQVAETGTTTTATTNNPIVTALQQQNALLQQQLHAQQQTNTILQNNVNTTQPNPVSSPTTNAPSVSIKVNGFEGTTTIPYGFSPTASWTSNGTVTCNVLSPSIGLHSNLGTSGNISLGQFNTGTYPVTISCPDNNGNLVTDSATIVVGANPNPVTPIVNKLRVTNNDHGFSNSISSETNSIVAIFDMFPSDSASIITNMTFKISGDVSSSLSNFKASFGGPNNTYPLNFDSNGVANLTSSNLTIPYGTASSLVIRADIAPNTHFGPAPVITITSASVVDSTYNAELTPTLPIDGPNVTIN